jgi:hypothetical protein
LDPKFLFSLIEDPGIKQIVTRDCVTKEHYLEQGVREGLLEGGDMEA